MNDSLLFNEYLGQLQAKQQLPTLEYLRSLIKLHLKQFPFENIGKMHYYSHRGKTGLQWLPDMATFLDDAASEGLGGNCYILNLHFGTLLQFLGFRTDIVRATGGNTHLALIVTVEGKSYYVDVGYGAPLFDPICLEEQPRFTRFGEEVEITKLDDHHYVIDRRSGGQTIVAKTIERQPVTLDSFDEAITHSLRDADENPFMRRIIATRFCEETAYSVINRKLFIKTDRGTEAHELTDRSEWLDMMRTTFGFGRDMLGEALQFLESRAVYLF